MKYNMLTNLGLAYAAHELQVKMFNNQFQVMMESRRHQTTFSRILKIKDALNGKKLMRNVNVKGFNVNFHHKSMPHKTSNFHKSLFINNISFMFFYQ